MSDEHEIVNLLGQYCRAIDDRDWDHLARLLADDVRFDMGEAVTDTRAALFEHMETNLWPAGRHLTLNPTVDVEGDTARAVSDWLWLDPKLAIAGAGRYMDEFRRHDGSWIFASRTITFFQPATD